MIGNTRQIRVIGTVQGGQVVLTREAERWFDDLYNRTGGSTSIIENTEVVSQGTFAQAVPETQVLPSPAVAAPEAQTLPSVVVPIQKERFVPTIVAPTPSYTQDVVEVTTATYTVPYPTFDHTILHCTFSGAVTITLPLKLDEGKLITVKNETGDTVTVQGQ